MPGARGPQDKKTGAKKGKTKGRKSRKPKLRVETDEHPRAEKVRTKGRARQRGKGPDRFATTNEGRASEQGTS